ncbi:hypothetical protein [Planctomyces sp. SH-PL14]|uniref:hypothetical protein n=1 Tax=Planctomyces sp. SH-PL14 TaxID=1632864 RepID=UPI00078D5389|nr:hypothetical protein [Planctomyces sp. SH-PL14]AMV20407.1 hypothetical protein VT03_21090 [Planctomyces sp. SH-PL14]
MGPERFEQLLAMERVDPWGEERADWRAAQTSALAGREGSEKLFWDPTFAAVPATAKAIEKPPQQQSVEDVKRVLAMYRQGRSRGKVKPDAGGQQRHRLEGRQRLR